MIAGIHIFLKCGSAPRVIDEARSLFPNATFADIYNTGWECQAYLYYIASNYDSLPARMLFLNGNPECHTPMLDLGEMLKCMDFSHPFLHMGICVCVVGFDPAFPKSLTNLLVMQDGPLHLQVVAVAGMQDHLRKGTATALIIVACAYARWWSGCGTWQSKQRWVT